MFIVLEISSQDWNALATEFTHIAQNVRGIHIQGCYTIRTEKRNTARVTYHNATYNFHHKITQFLYQLHILICMFRDLQPLYKSCIGKRHSKYKTVVTIY